MRKIINSLLIITLLLSSTASFAVKKKVLFIGNSYIAVNNLPTIVDSICQAMGDTLVYDQNVPGGYTFQMHSADLGTITKINLTDWDVVVLQEQSQKPSFPPSQVATEVYPYATRLDSFVRAHDTCTQTMYMMTWGRANGDASNCPFYPMVCTYAGMQSRLRESYLDMGTDNHACVAPVGAAWKAMRDSFPLIWLYSADSSHPAINGSYLEAAVMYASIFHKSPESCTYVATGMVPAQAATIRRIAKKVTLDSLYTWQRYGHYPYSGFTVAGATNTKTFTNLSPVSAKHRWSFGDTQSDTVANPVHRYTAIGTYTVTHTIYNDCFSETFTDTVRITTISIGLQSLNTAPNEVRIANYGSGSFSVEFSSMAIAGMAVYSIDGKCVKQYTNTGTTITDNLPAGMYIYKAWSKETGSVVTHKFVVY
ncbi:MAG: T9SS C-terminal target domain-containing protein [Chitinophagia bacterium]|nr:T9SS C-terminal target domain-containing protein [Chitinophagia bacterium]